MRPSALQVLWLCDNPCADDPAYKATVTRYLPHLQKLDNEDLITGERDPHTRGPPASPSHAAMMHGGGPSRGSPAASRSNSYTPEPAGIPNLTAVMHEPPPPSRGTPQRSSKNILYAVSGALPVPPPPPGHARGHNPPRDGSHAGRWAGRHCTVISCAIRAHTTHSCHVLLVRCHAAVPGSACRTCAARPLCTVCCCR